MAAKALSFGFVIFSVIALHAQVGLSRDELKLFNLVNQERVKAGLPKLQWNYHLAESARAHSQLMAKRDTLSHQFPGESPLGDRVGATGVRFDLAAENVAEGDTIDDVHLGFMGSEQHRANILSPKYNALGLAVVSQGDDLWVTQDFADVLPSYSEQQFRDAVVAAFNKARDANKLESIAVRVDSHLHDLACAESNNAKQIIQDLPGAADLVVFTSNVPDKLSNSMQKTAADDSLHRMDIGVCFAPSKESGNANFRVVAAFYP